MKNKYSENIYHFLLKYDILQIVAFSILELYSEVKGDYDNIVRHKGHT